MNDDLATHDAERHRQEQEWLRSLNATGTVHPLSENVWCLIALVLASVALLVVVRACSIVGLFGAATGG